MPRQDLIKTRAGTAAEWTAANPILEKGELGHEVDTHKLKGGDGLTEWNSLSYISAGGGGGGGNSWGSITGTLSSQTDLQSALNAKQDDLVSGTSIKTINGASILGSGDLVVSGGGSVDSVNGLTGVVVLDKSDIGLSNVDNTSDIDMPISTATQTALDLKANISSLPIMATAQIDIPRTQGGRFEHYQVITDANVSPSSKISISLSSMGDNDENQAEFIDLLALTATAGTGNFTAIASFQTKTAGIINLNYIIGV